MRHVPPFGAAPLTLERGSGQEPTQTLAQTSCCDYVEPSHEYRQKLGSRSCSPFPPGTTPPGRTLGHPKVALCLWLGSLGTKVPCICHIASQLEFVGLWIGELQAAGGASWVGLGISSCQGMQGTGPGSSWLGYPDAIPFAKHHPSHESPRAA